MKDENITGQIIKQRRKMLGMTQEELAKKAGYKARTSINRIENGLIQVPDSKLKKFAEVLNCSIPELLGKPKKMETIGDFFENYNTYIDRCFIDSLFNIAESYNFKNTELEDVERMLRGAILIENQELERKIKESSDYYNLFLSCLKKALELEEEKKEQFKTEVLKNSNTLMFLKHERKNLIELMKKYGLE